MLDPERVEGGEVLTRLWHPGVVGRDHEQHDRRRPETGQGGVDEPLVAGHVDEGHVAEVRQPAPAVAEPDRQAALLLLGQPVGIVSGEALDEAGLAVIDVPGGGDDVH